VRGTLPASSLTTIRDARDRRWFVRAYQPLVSQANLIPNLTRVQTFGSPNINWVEVTVEPKDRALFTMQPMIVQ
jgi:hypothetical protein